MSLNVSMGHALALIAVIWLIGSILLMMRSIRRGQVLTDMLASRHPDIYQALGRPRPGYFDSARRRRFAQFVGGREFESLADRSLVTEFERYRKSEARLIVIILGVGMLVALLAFAIGPIHPDWP